MKFSIIFNYLALKINDENRSGLQKLLSSLSFSLFIA